MPAMRATCGVTYPHAPHKANIEQVPWDSCGGAAFAACGENDQHQPHFENEQADDPVLCLGGAVTEQDGPAVPEPSDVLASALGAGLSISVNEDASQITVSSRPVAALRDWWMEIAQQEVEKVGPKAVEYGSTDLVEIGRDLSHLASMWEGKDDEAHAELGIYFYIIGKMARWRDAIQRGERVSDDTLHDIGVYARMAQRVRAVGGWPFGPDEIKTQPAPISNEELEW